MIYGEVKEGNVNEQYDIGNSASSWDGFRARYAAADTEIAPEVSTTGKYVARKLRDMGFHTHMADPSTLALIFRTAKKNDREDSYKLAKLLRLEELPEVHLPSRSSDDLRSLTRYRRSIGNHITMIKNRIHALLSSYGVAIDATDIFGRKGIAQIHAASSELSDADRLILSSMLERISVLRNHAASVDTSRAISVSATAYLALNPSHDDALLPISYCSFTFPSLSISVTDTVRLNAISDLTYIFEEFRVAGI